LQKNINLIRFNCDYIGIISNESFSSIGRLFLSPVWAF